MYPTGKIGVRTLRNSFLGSSSTLRYSNGTCTWTLTIDLGKIIAPAVSESMGPEQLLPNSDFTNEYDIKCEVNNTLILHAEGKVLGEL